MDINNLLFRARLKDDTDFIEFGLFDYYTDLEAGEISIHNIPIDNINLDNIMQYTTYNDINGNKVFDKDIVKDIEGDDCEYVVSFEKGCFILRELCVGRAKINKTYDEFAHLIKSFKKIGYLINDIEKIDNKKEQIQLSLFDEEILQ